MWDSNYINDGWSKNDSRLSPERFSSLTYKWTRNTPYVPTMSEDKPWLKSTYLQQWHWE